jgi:hypothetical protein
MTKMNRGTAWAHLKNLHGFDEDHPMIFAAHRNSGQARDIVHIKPLAATVFAWVLDPTNIVRRSAGQDSHVIWHSLGLTRKRQSLPVTVSPASI